MKLPDSVMALYDAHQAMCKDLAHTGFTFTLDGKLLGDIGEALVAERLKLKRPPKRTPGVDAIAEDGRSVQIKATQDKSAGPAFSRGKGRAKHLIFVWLDFEEEKRAHVLYDGPEDRVRDLITDPENQTSTIRLNRAAVVAENAKVNDEDRLYSRE